MMSISLIDVCNSLKIAKEKIQIARPDISNRLQRIALASFDNLIYLAESYVNLCEHNFHLSGKIILRSIYEIVVNIENLYVHGYDYFLIMYFYHNQNLSKLTRKEFFQEKFSRQFIIEISRIDKIKQFILSKKDDGIEVREIFWQIVEFSKNEKLKKLYHTLYWTLSSYAHPKLIFAEEVESLADPISTANDDHKYFPTIKEFIEISLDKLNDLLKRDIDPEYECIFDKIKDLHLT